MIDVCTQIQHIQVGSEFLVERAVPSYSMNLLNQHAVRVREVKGTSGSMGVERGSSKVSKHDRCRCAQDLTNLGQVALLINNCMAAHHCHLLQEDCIIYHRLRHRSGCARAQVVQGYEQASRPPG